MFCAVFSNLGAEFDSNDNLHMKKHEKHEKENKNNNDIESHSARSTTAISISIYDIFH